MNAKVMSSVLLLVGATVAGCGEGTDRPDDVSSTASALFYPLKTFSEGDGTPDRTIYAVNNFQGTPRVRLTTKNIFTGTCYSYERGLAPQSKIDSKICSALSLLYEFVSFDTSFCSTVAPSPVKLGSFSYEFFSVYETQLNYNVVDVGPDPMTGTPTIFGQSTWFGSNGCPRNYSPM